jgi:Tfp pilus assembly protein PilF
MQRIERLQQLLHFLEEEPDSPFNLYAIALEYIKLSDVEKALEYFDKLLKMHESYVPSYYHAAALYAETEQNEQAKAIYEKGIEISKKIGDAHALRELQNAYQNFLFEME